MGKLSRQELRMIDRALNQEPPNTDALVALVAAIEADPEREMPKVLDGLVVADGYGTWSLEFAVHMLRGYGWFHAKEPYVKISRDWLDENYPCPF